MAKANNTPKRPSGAQTVIRALGLLECFTSEHPELSLTELSNLTGLTVPTTHRLLRTLIGQRFLVFDAGTKQYSLGPAVMQLAGAIIHRDDLHHVVTPHLERLRRESGETVGLHLLVDLERVCIIELESRQRIRMSSGVGYRYPLHRGAAGKVLLAHLPERHMEAYRAREPDIDWKGLDSDLPKVRREDFAMSFGEVVEGANALAVAILDSSRFPIAAINVTGPSNRWTTKRMLEVAPDLRATVHDIEVQLGHSQPDSPSTGTT